MSHRNTARYLGILALASSSCASEPPADTGPTEVVFQTESWKGLGQWLISALVTESTTTNTCDENWLEYDCRSGGSGMPVFDTTEDATRTPPGRVVTIFTDEGEAVWLTQADGRVYPGTREGETFTFTWEGSQDSESTVESAQSLPTGQRYSSTRTRDGSSTTTISLTVDLAEGTATGTSAFSLTSSTTWIETDEWNRYDNDYASSRLRNDAYQYLDGGYEVYYNANDAYDDDCSGTNCQLSFGRTTVLNHDLTGNLVSADVETALEDIRRFYTPSDLGSAPF